jgi:hypothetical protein
MYLFTISNIVPPRASEETVDCAVCRRQMRTDSKGNVFRSDKPWWVCDDCGAREAASLFPLLQQLRAAVDFTVTIGGANIEDDSKAWDCPCCGFEGDGQPDGWHIVDLRGRPVCEACIPGMDLVLRQCAEALRAAYENTKMISVLDSTSNSEPN